MRMRGVLAAGLVAMAASQAAAITFDFAAVEIPPGGVRVFHGEFSATDSDGDGWLHTNEISGYDAELMGGSLWGPSAWGVATRWGDRGFFSLAYDMDGVIGDDPGEWLSFGYVRTYECAPYPGGPTVREVTMSPSASLRGVSLVSDVCSESYWSVAFDESVELAVTHNGPLAAPLPLPALLLGGGLGALVLVRRRRG